MLNTLPLWKKLFFSIFPGVGPDDLDAPGETLDDVDSNVTDDSEDLEELPDSNLDDADAPVTQRKPRAEDTSRYDAAVDRANRLEEDVAELKRQRTGPSESDRQRAEDDRKLDDPNTDELTKWQLRSNRIMSDANVNAQKALNEAQDMRDEAKFLSGSVADPRRAKYAERIEKELKVLRSKGQNVDRETLYYYQLGKDIASGALKAAPKKVSAQAALPRGKLVSARSDVRASGRGRSASGARERLSNTTI